MAPRADRLSAAITGRRAPDAAACLASRAQRGVEGATEPLLGSQAARKPR
jgi:hypothetical protein